jgi:23S rRNA (pseudouridine1915-N3)-methyltransferase
VNKKQCRSLVSIYNRVDMNIHLISVGNRMPGWVVEGYNEYARRMPKECALQLIEIAPGHRAKGADIQRTLRDEGERMLKALPKNCLVLALDVRGSVWSTEALSRKLGAWLSEGHDLALLVGGPEGLAEACLARAEGRWSLSALTLPHPLVRVVVAEQLYRAWSLLRNHPYHRAG